MNSDKKGLISAISILVGTSVGAGIFAMPYVASKAGFFVSLFYILFLGTVIMFVHLYLGEVSLRTKGNHQLPGYAEKYLGRKGKILMQFSTVFGIFSALIAYMFGVGNSLSFLFFGNLSYYLYFGVAFGLVMSFFLYKGIGFLKKFEKVGVIAALIVVVVIFFTFLNKVNYSNIMAMDQNYFLLPFGIILFSFLAFSAIPHVEIVLHKKEKLMKKSIIISGIICMFVYTLFTFVIVGFKGKETPEIATLAFGGMFIFLGILTMFNAYLSLGNAMQLNFSLDNNFSKKKAWFFACIIPIFIFISTQFFSFLSFTTILSLGGVVAGGLTGALASFMVREAKKKGNRKPEYSMPVNWFYIAIIILVFIIGILSEII
jgi:tyrosine-specific transport protein